MVQNLKVRAPSGERGPNQTSTKKLMLQNIGIGLLNRISPMVKVCLIGLILDTYPHLIASRNKLTVIPDAKNMLFVLSLFRDQLITGTILKRLVKNYPKRNSWVTALFVSCLSFQLLSPSKIEYPPRPTFESEDLLYRHGVTSTHLGFKLGEGHKAKPKIVGNGLTRQEVDGVVKNFLAAFVSVMLGVWMLRGHKASVLPRRKNVLTLALFTLFQAGHVLWKFQNFRTRALGKPWQILTPWVNFNLNLFGRIAEVGFFGWSAYRVMMCWFYKPSLLPRPFQKWLSKFVDIERPLLEYLRGLHNGTIVEGRHSDALVGFCRSLGLNPHLGDPYYGVPSCRVFHYLDGDNCVQSGVRRFLVAFIRAFISLYLPLNLLIYIFTRAKQTDPENQEFASSLTKLKEKVVYPAARSSAFLGTLFTSIFATSCLLRNKLGTDRYNVVAGSAICGLTSILIELPTYRVIPTLFLLPIAVRSFYVAKFERYVPAQYLDTPILTLSLTLLMTCFQLQPHSVHPPTRALLNWIFAKYPLR